MKQRTSKNVTEFSSCWSSTAGHGACPWSVLHIQWAPLEKTDFLFVSSCQLEIVTGLRRPSSSPLNARTTSGPDLCLLLQSLGVHMCVRPAVLRRPCLLGVLHFPCSWSLSTSSSTGFPEAWFGGSGDSPFRPLTFTLWTLPGCEN